jgi:hypothetical protein
MAEHRDSCKSTENLTLAQDMAKMEGIQDPVSNATP